MNAEQIRHKSPKTQNNFFNNYNLKSPSKKDFSIINLRNNNIGLAFNEFQFNNNSNNHNYYEEIKKAFNFITFILKQKDSQIKKLQIKIKDLENQLNDINERNIMTFNNKDICQINSEEEKNKNSLKRETYNFIPNNKRIFYSINTNKMNKNNENDILMSKNTKINIINRVKNSTNINKINNYRNKIDLNIKKYNYISNISNTKINDISDSDYLNTEENKGKNYLNLNINEHSKEKNINIIRKEPYHSNMNMNYNIKNKNSNENKIKNLQTNETDTSTRNDKIKIFSLSPTGNPYSKNSNSIVTLSDEGLSQQKTEIKNYLREVKSKIDKDKFKKFVSLIKTLIKNKNSTEKYTIIYEIKNILVDKNLITKFESILKIK